MSNTLRVVFSRNTRKLTKTRCYSAVSTRVAPVDVDHYTSPWWQSYGDVNDYKSEKLRIQTFNKISPKGLERFPADIYELKSSAWDTRNAHAILLRSHKLKVEEVDVSVRAIARCGAGTNNVPVKEMTAIGIPVFNTPGANANAVKELVLAGMLLGSRRIVDGINHMKVLGASGQAKERVEKDKAMFGGQEIAGKRLAVIGLGHIGSATARDAASLGMSISGYDPGLSIKSALKLPRDLQLCDSISAAIKDADYISINIPYIKGSPASGGTHGIIGADVISHMKPEAILLNFARGELIDSEALKVFLDSGNGRYVSDFPDDILWDHKNAIILPHLGASTEEAEDAAAAMAADTIRDYLESGTIVNSVNFPTSSLPDRPENSIRFTVVNKNIPGMLAKITDIFGRASLNILQQVNNSKDTIAYNVIDCSVNMSDDSSVLSLQKMQKDITMLDGVLSSRVLFGKPGAGYAVQRNSDYIV
jgi:D-3-phosphoglycerate dehydrogenase